MNSGRRLSMKISLRTASVFLCLALLFSCFGCGIPNYIIPTVSMVTGSENGISTEFTLNYSSDSSVAGSKDRIGLLLLYYIDDAANSEKTRIPNNFKEKYVTSDYDGVVVNLKSPDEPVVNYDYNGIEHKAYAFTLDGDAVSAPYYVYAQFGGLDNTASVSLNIKLSYNSGDKTVTLNDGTNNFKLGFDSSFTPEENRYIRIFAAVSVQSENYSNLYWSAMKYVGAIKL